MVSNRLAHLPTMMLPTTTHSLDRSPCGSSHVRRVEPLLTTLQVEQSTPSQMTKPALSVLRMARTANLGVLRGGVYTITYIQRFFKRIVFCFQGNANPDGDIMSKQVPFPKAYPWLLWSSMSMHVAAYPRDFTHLVAILDPAKNSTHW